MYVFVITEDGKIVPIRFFLRGVIWFVKARGEVMKVSEFFSREDNDLVCKEVVTLFCNTAEIMEELCSYED